MSHRPSGACANDGLIASITKLVYTPGHRLVDALRKPDAGRIVKHVPCIGTIVNKRNHSEVVDLYKAWVVPDHPATERAVHRGIGVDFAMSEDITQKILAERDGLAQTAVLDRNVCQTVYSACRNRVLLTATWVLNTSLLLPGPTPFFDRTRRKAFVAQHQPFIGVMRRRETHEASQTVEGLLQSALRRRARALAS